MTITRRELLQGLGALGLAALLRDVVADAGGPMDLLPAPKTLPTMTLPTMASPAVQAARPIARAPLDTRLVIINPGHNKQAQLEGKGTYVRGIGHEYEIVTEIADLVVDRLKAAGIPYLVTRTKEEYRADIEQYAATHRQELEAEFIESLKHGKHDITMREGVLQLAMMRYAELRRASAMVNIHIDDGPWYSKKGFTAYVGNHHKETDLERRKRLHIEEFDNCSMTLAESIRDALATTKIDGRPLPASNVRRSVVDAPAVLDKRGRVVCKAKTHDIPGLSVHGYFILGNGRVKMSVPSVLVECGFIKQEYAFGNKKLRINDSRVQELYADAIAAGIRGYLL